MPGFDPITPKYYKLSANEQHLHSFGANNLEWVSRQRYVVFGDVVSYALGTPTFLFDFVIHITDKRMIIEPSYSSEPNTFSTRIFDALTPFAQSKIVDFLGGFAKRYVEQQEQIKAEFKGKPYVEFRYDAVKHIARAEENRFWVVEKGSKIDVGFPFFPLYVDEKGNTYGNELFSKYDLYHAANEFCRAISRFCRIIDAKDVVPIR